MRTQFGAGRSSGSQHSQSLEALLAHIPGLSVVMPSTPADTYGLLRAAIQDPNPVVFIENRLLYGMKGPQPPADHLVPIGTLDRRPARDPTSPSSRCRGWCTRRWPPPRSWPSEGISVEVIDLRTVAPLDLEPVLDSVHKTSRILIAHEAVVPFGIGAEIAATGRPRGLLGSRCAHRTRRRRRRPRPPTPPSSNGRGSPTATRSPRPSAAWPAV